ncbi:hypothetical protein H4R35_003511 [Dimargaris xerosporica]|nr:hypothetical protein H4R35_003511 [Dimargaris xerosporica]
MNPNASHRSSVIILPSSPLPPPHSPTPDTATAWSSPDQTIEEPSVQVKQLSAQLNRFESAFTFCVYVFLIIAVSLIIVVAVPLQNRTIPCLIVGLLALVSLVGVYCIRRRLRQLKAKYDHMSSIAAEVQSFSASTDRLSVLPPPPPSYQAALNQPPAYPQLSKLPSYQSLRRESI